MGYWFGLLAGQTGVIFISNLGDIMLKKAVISKLSSELSVYFKDTEKNLQANIYHQKLSSTGSTG